MCTVSMIMQAQQKVWPWPPVTLPITEASLPFFGAESPYIARCLVTKRPSGARETVPFPAYEGPTKEQFEEFLNLLREAKKFDEKMGQKDCEMEIKKAWLRALAEHLGVNLERL